MPDILIQSPTFGLNATLPVTMLDPRAAADGSYNFLYENGRMGTMPGLARYNISSALNSGDTVLHVFTCRIKATDHIIAVTREKLYRYDVVNDTWDDLTQSGVTMSSNLDHPVSYAVVSHDDTDVYYDDSSSSSHAYEHIVVCDGGLSDIQRWAGEGEADFGNLLGSDDYSGSGPHRALQVGTAQNRLLLISPLEYNTTSRVWVENEVRVRWPRIGKLESWTGTGSGAVDLRDAGGKNVWSAPLGTEYYVYQTNSIWNMRYVGGTAIFDPRPAVQDLGLLSYHLLVAHSNIHYFVGSDYNVHAFFGGTQKLAIGDPIKDFLYRDIETDHVKRCWMAMDVNADRLWIFIVPDGGTYITKAYGYSLKDKSWFLSDLSDKFNSTTGITVAAVVAGTTHTTGETYAAALTQISASDISDAGDATLRYGDTLCEVSRTLTSEVTNATWCAGGTYLACATGAFLTDMTKGDILFVEDGSAYTNCRYGSHYYTVKDLSNSYLELWDRDASLGISDTTAVPSGVPFTVWTDEGESYAEQLSIIRTEDVLVVGTNNGWMYYFDDSLAGTLYDTTVHARHYTPVFDGGQPGMVKRWPGLRITAKKPTADQDGQVLVYYRTTGFDSTTGWTRMDASFALDATWQTKDLWINRAAKAIQFAFMDNSGSVAEIREFAIMPPKVEVKR